MDMSYNYKLLEKKLGLNASVTVDKFHVTKMIPEELNQARIDQKKVAKSLSVKEKVKLFSSLKGSKYILLKAEQSLSPNKKQNYYRQK
jgi:transposase